MNLRAFLPNLMTLANLFCGILAILFIWKGNEPATLWCLAIALFLDFGDGFVARMLEANSDLGKELDSLADMVSFGFVPGMVMMRMIHEAFGFEFTTENILNYEGFPWPLVAFSITLFSALRLAKFNLDTRQSDVFFGLPTPSCTVGIVSLWMIPHFHPNSWMVPYIENPWILVVITVIFSFLLVSELKLIAAKFKNFTWTDNSFRFILIILGVLLLVLFQFVAVPFIILLYIALSMIQNRLET